MADAARVGAVIVEAIVRAVSIGRPSFDLHLFFPLLSLFNLFVRLYSELGSRPALGVVPSAEY